MKVQFTLSGAPRTKKTHQRIVRMGKFSKILPSEQYQAWFGSVLWQGQTITRRLTAGGAVLPLLGPVTVKALIYREANTGDACGYYQAIGDAIQGPIIRNGKQTRDGLGIIQDDRQIANWDGSKLLKDAKNPRIEITVETLPEGKA